MIYRKKRVLFNLVIITVYDDGPELCHPFLFSKRLARNVRKSTGSVIF